MDKLNWHIEKRKVKDLILWDRNPRSISTESFEKLKERIARRGFHDVIKIDIDNTILSGNQRKRALEELDVEEVSVMVPNKKLMEDERDKVAIESNMNDGIWNFEELANFDEAILKELGWSSEDLDKVFQTDLEGDDFDLEEEIERITEVTVKEGDLYEINGHRILCGDSKNIKSFEKLFYDK